ncbi:hypothetical protein [Actinophytocola sp.]|uniref:hypothetical protein n=1 Tax=Actinophytocola sp. TaxID=1872138 RepID=UPI002D7F347E|nr:hypothetical protein [Actinophytocola sp.]HET9139082.1 hypothetical protein [Actinophytocola sp.]
MRFTEQDLRDLLVAREQVAVEPDRVHAGIRAGVVQRRQRRTATIAVSAACAVVALGVSLAYVAGQREPDPGATGETSRVTETAPATSSPAPLTSRPPLGFTLSDKNIAGLVVQSIEVGSFGQAVTLWTAPGPSAQGTELDLWLFEPGVYQPNRAGESLQVAGREAYLGTVPFPNGNPDGNPKPGPDNPALAWQYADGAWAVLQAGYTRQPPFDGSAAREKLLEIAARITPEQPRHARLPYRFGYVPEGARASLVAQTMYGAVTLYLTTGGKRELLIRAAPDRPVIQNKPLSPNTDLNGHPAIVKPGVITLYLDAFYVQVSGDPAEYSVEELTRVAAGMTFATWTDPTTWFNAADVIR